MLRKFVNWLHKRLNKNRLPDIDYDTYSPVERMIYSYFDGQGVVRADPMVLFRRLTAKQTDMRVYSQIGNSKSKDAGSAQEKYLGMVRSIFNVKPFDDGGLTEQETDALLDHFFLYCSFIKKNSSPTTTTAEGILEPSGPPTPEPAAGSSEGQDTKNTSPSGSSSEGPSTDNPPQSPSAAG